MISLKTSKAEAKAEGVTDDPTPPEYPWGTRVTLVDEVAKAMFPEMPTVGATVAIDANATVASVNIVQQQGGGSRVSIELQLTDMDIEEPEETTSAAEKLYGKDGPKA